MLRWLERNVAAGEQKKDERDRCQGDDRRMATAGMVSTNSPHEGGAYADPITIRVHLLTFRAVVAAPKMTVWFSSR
jgi:hypothetical protein